MTEAAEGIGEERDLDPKVLLGMKHRLISARNSVAHGSLFY